MTGVGDLIPYLAGALALGGVAVALSRRREYVLRWCAWAVAVPVVVAALSLGPGGAAVLAAAVGAGCAVEYGRLTRLPWPDRVVLTVAAAASPLAAWLVPAELPRVLAACVLAVALVPLLAGDAAGGLRRLCLGVAGVVWFAPLIGVVLLGPAVLALFAAVSVADITASFAGRSMGGPRLSPLSPAKRWSGLLAGAAAGLAVLALLDAFTLPLAVAVTVGAPLGTCWSR
ncbi:phosphatidate cytidylyltransferase [Nonomuraea sp. NPDC050691]|uniref:phosphatidate cytidylyltransferase n=1 Tax=Nonomuraea sp. NPDC050691 TaxID=3155661 RepID=UPI0033D53C23